eukprot:scaffold236216_cov66-Attheya_sp.AAC.1
MCYMYCTLGRSLDNVHNSPDYLLSIGVTWRHAYGFHVSRHPRCVKVSIRAGPAMPGVPFEPFNASG